MAHPISFATTTEVLNLDISALPQGFAVVCIELKSWLIYDATASDATVAGQIFAPTVGAGRWFRSNNTANKLNTITSVTTTTSTTVADFTSVEQVRVVFTQNSTINLQTVLRNGAGSLLLDRNSGSWTITGWDSRVRWGTWSVFAFTSNFAIIEFTCINNLIYVKSITSY
ncbi:MAG: hypothetical protein IM526_02550 [Microcystis sp. M38BS1]|uniref:hypothetical protein n=1 Tax=Microcystis sp. M38BS1 TaxID=2771188 RepID=UPI0031FCBD4B|nr:hypothetical protein [Microcystis sp. M38BS1]MCA6582539.1 hypothetical protein [Pseudanabaena sp. M34BS1SP1A06MG]